MRCGPSNHNFGWATLQHACVIVDACVCVLVLLLHEVTELYRHRADKLLERHTDYMTEWIVEKFARGRVQHLQGIK